MSSILKLRTLLGAGVGAVYEFFAAYEAFCFIKMMQSSPTAAYLRGLSLHERLVLTSLIKCIKREGVEEIKWSEVLFLSFPSKYSYLNSFRWNTNIWSIPMY